MTKCIPPRYDDMWDEYQEQYQQGLLMGQRYHIHPSGFLVDDVGFVADRETAFALVSRVLSHYYGCSGGEIEQANHDNMGRHFGRREKQSAPTPARTPRPGFVYLMSNGRYYKVGVTNDPERRRKEIEKASGYPIDITLTVYADDPYTVEKDIHNMLFAFRVEGEWFNLPADVLHDTMDYMRGLEES